MTFSIQYCLTTLSQPSNGAQQQDLP